MGQRSASFLCPEGGDDVGKQRVRCMECGVRMSRAQVIPVLDETGDLIGYLCRECE